ncbi:hypothetical protein Tco_1001184, partial [Tanacetum coccineum]
MHSNLSFSFSLLYRKLQQLITHLILMISLKFLVEHIGDAKYQRCLDEEHGKEEEEDVTESPKAAKATKSKIAKQTKPSAPKASEVTKPPKLTPTTTEPSKKDQSKKHKLVKETSDAPS